MLGSFFKRILDHQAALLAVMINGLNSHYPATVNRINRKRVFLSRNGQNLRVRASSKSSVFVDPVRKADLEKKVAFSNLSAA